MSPRSKMLKSSFTRQLLLAIVLTVILFFIIGRLLKLFTHHGNEIKVPSLIGMKMADLEDKSLLEDFEILILDSIYDLEKPKGSIAFQDPPSGSLVKRGRTIYLTLVAIMPEQVKMPNLVDLTLRQALAVLETYGLKPGFMEYVPDIAKNAVLRQKYSGKAIDPDTWIEKGSRIDLVLGKGGSSDGNTVPFLLGMQRLEAIRTLKAAFFRLGNEIYLDEKDTLYSRVYRQSPSYLSGANISSGASIDLWYRSDKKFDFDTYLDQYRRDSLSLDLGIDSL